MKKTMKRILSFTLSIMLVLSLTPVISLSVSANEADSYPKYEDEQMTDGGFETKTGSSATYWNPDDVWAKAFFEYVHKDTVGDEYVHSGNQSLRFLSIAGNRTFYMTNTAKKAITGWKVGDTYELSGYFKTSNPNGATVRIESKGFSGLWVDEDGNTLSDVTVSDDGWTKITARMTIPANMAANTNFDLRFYTNQRTNPQGQTKGLRTWFGKFELNPAYAPSRNVDNEGNPLTEEQVAQELPWLSAEIQRENELALSDPTAYQTHYIYMDDLSFRKIVNLEAKDLSIDKSGDATDSVMTAAYTYGGVMPEDGSIIEWQYADSASSITWTTFKTLIKGEADNEWIEITPDLVNKYVRVQVTPKDGVNTGKVITSSAVLINGTTNILSNGNFYKTVLGWGEDASFDSESYEDDTTGSMKFNGNVSKTSVCEINSTTILGAQVYLKGEEGNVVTVTLADRTEEFTMTGEWQECNIVTSVSSAENITLSLSSVSDILADNITIEPKVPVAKDVTVSGSYMVGSILTASYEYDASIVDNEDEGESVIKWYSAASASAAGTEIGSGETYTIQQRDNGKYIYAGVTPVTQSGVWGVEAFSTRKACFSVSVSNMSIENYGGYKTNGILIPSYSYVGTFAESSSKLEWVMADSPDAPDEVWEKIVTMNATTNTRKAPMETVTASTVAENGWIPLNQSTRGKYVTFRITPVDVNGNEGTPVLCDERPFIEFERNIISNGSFITEIGTKGHKVASGSKGSVSSENSPLKGYDDGTSSWALDATPVDSAAQKTGALNSGGSIFCIYAPESHKTGVTYELKADVKLDYEENDITQNFTYMYQGGTPLYTQQTATSGEWTTVTHTFTGGAEYDPVTQYTQISFRAMGNANDTRIVKSGKWLLDNVEMYAQVPYVTDINIKGNSKIGDTLSATYTFHKALDIANEYETEVKWLQSDYPWGPWEVINTTKGTDDDVYSLLLTEELEGKYIRLSVTPQDMLTTKGLEMQTTDVLFVRPMDTIVGNGAGCEIIVEGSMTSGSTIQTAVDFTNVQLIDRDITVALAVYKTVNGEEKLTDISFETKNVVSGGDAQFAPSLTLDENSGTTSRVFVLEGSNFDKLIPLLNIENSGAKKVSMDDDRAFADNDKMTAEIRSKTENPNTRYSLVVVKDGVNLSDITPENAKENIIYFGQGMSGNDASYQHSFSIDGAVSGDVYNVVATYDSGVQNRGMSFKYNGSEAASAIANAIKNADTETAKSYLEGTKIDSAYDMVEILAIDTTYYNQLDDKSYVLNAIAGKDFSNNTSKIREIVEEEAKARFSDEQWMKNVDLSLAEISEATPDTLPDVLAKHNYLYNFDLANKYGFAINLNSENKVVFMNAVKTALLAANGNYTGTYDVDAKKSLVEAKISAFENEAALQAVNLGAWEDMEKILNTHKDTFGIDLTGKYASITENQRIQLHKDIFKETYSSISDFVSGSKGFNTLLGNITEDKTESGGSGGGFGGGSFGGGGSTGGSPSISFGEEAGSTSKSEIAFKDVKSDHWATEYINTCAGAGIVNGYTDGTFLPEKEVTRAEFLAMLVRSMNIKAAANSDISFTDVNGSDWYYDFVMIAASNGIVNGKTASMFKPNDMITREEMAVMTARCIHFANVKPEITNTEVSFADEEDVSDYAKTSVKELSGYSIINGMGDGKFVPKNNVTRAMAAKIVYEILRIS